MTHFELTSYVIGHDVIVNPDISNERARPKLYASEVSCTMHDQFQIYRRFFPAQFCPKISKFSKKPKNPRRGAGDGTLKVDPSTPQRVQDEFG